MDKVFDSSDAFLDAVQKAAWGESLSRTGAKLLLDQIFNPLIGSFFRTHHFFSEVTGLEKAELYGELWVFASTPGEESGKSLWQNALESSAKRSSSVDDRVNQLKKYLYSSLKRHLKKMLMAGSTTEAVRSVIIDACKQASDFGITDNSMGSYHATIRPASNPEKLSRWTAEELDQVLPSLSVPSPKGTRKTLSGATFPTPLQVVDLIRQIFQHRSTEIPVSCLIDAIIKIYQIPRQRVTVSVEDETKNSEDERQPSHDLKEELKNISTQAEQEKLGEAEMIIGHADQLLGEVAKADKAPFKETGPEHWGKLTRLLLDFLLWQNFPVHDDESRWFGYDLYSEQTGEAISTLQERFTKKLMPLIESFCRKHQLSPRDLRAVLLVLRERFLSRKPEILTDSNF